MRHRGLGLAALLALLAALAPRSSAAPEPALWPMPLSVKTSPRLLHLSRDNFSIGYGPSSTAGPTCSLLQEAFRRPSCAGSPRFLFRSSPHFHVCNPFGHRRGESGDEEAADSLALLATPHRRPIALGEVFQQPFFGVPSP